MRDATLAELAKARSGRRFASVNNGGKAFAKDNMSTNDLRMELAEITTALQAVNPELYGTRVRTICTSFLNA